MISLVICGSLNITLHHNHYALSYAFLNPALKSAQMNIQMTEVDELKKKLDEVLSLLRGNTLDKNDQGFIGIVDDLHKRVTSLEKWKDRIVWMVIGMGLPASVGVIEILKKIFIP